MRSAICPGTFDPITIGHESVIRRAARIFDTVYVAVLDNIEKKTVFSTEERVNFAKKIFADNENIKVITCNDSGHLDVRELGSLLPKGFVL